MKFKEKKRARVEVESPVRVESPKGKHDAVFKWFLGVSEVEFFKQYFEKKLLHFSHGTAAHFTQPPTGMPAVEWSTEFMLRLAAEKTLSYTTDINVVRFDKEQRKRVLFRTEGIVTKKDLEHCMQNGWSVRFLRPHEHAASNSSVIAMLEEIFGCYCGLNSYWTPANSQGFAPHYDDVDVFLIQLEGEKEWRLYDPPEDVDYLSRHSSEDYEPQQLPKPKFLCRLVPGDVLYMPRGTVHQGRTLSHIHSLHVTFSANQMNTWADLLKRSTTHVIEKLAANSISWRKSLPRLLLKTLGAIYHPDFRAESGLTPLTEVQQNRRQRHKCAFQKMVKQLTTHMLKEEAIDECCDLYARDTLAKMQPPSQVLKGGQQDTVRLGLDSIICLVAPNCARLVLAVSEEAHVYHSCGNSTICLGAPEGVLRFEADFAPAIATILALKERAICVSDLPFPSFDCLDDINANQVTLVNALRDAGIITVA